tara:strand:- start:24 stop:332 length:309 start_codon:yes stop_codon:yes gene_type:complete
MSNIAAVIGWKFNDQPGMVTKNNVITDFPGGIPSQADQDTWSEEYNAYLTRIAYTAKRVAAYPTIGDQFDLLYHDMTAGKSDKTGQWYTAIAKIKTDNPKPE